MSVVGPVGETGETRIPKHNDRKRGMVEVI